MAPKLTLGRITYNRGAGRYVGADGKFIARSAVINEVDKEQRRLDRKLQLRYSKLIDGGLTLPQFERQFIKEMKTSLIRSALVGHGGADTFNSRYVALRIGSLEKQIQTQFNVFFDLVTKIDKQTLSEAQIRDRLNRISRKVRVEFNEAELEARILDNGHNVGKRILDPNANHCPECPGLATKGFVAIENIVPVGTACRCGGYCHCRIITKNNPKAKSQAKTLTLKNSILKRKDSINVMLESIAANRKNKK